MCFHILSELERALVICCPFACYPNAHLRVILFVQCYKIVVGNDNKNWQDARTYCINQGGNLVSIVTEREQGE